MFLYVDTTCLNVGIVSVKPGFCACMSVDSHGLCCSTEVLRLKFVFLRFCVSSKNTMQGILIVYFCNAVGDI